jgi:hypothetical protein
MAGKNKAPPSRKDDEKKPAGISFDFEDLIAAAVSVVVLKRPRKRKPFIGVVPDTSRRQT